MKVIALKAENFARLKAVEIRPDGPVVPITGANSNGKTSVLNAIWTALQGRTVATPVPVRKGAEQARIRLTLGTDDGIEAIVTRTFTDDGDTGLKVELADGKPVRVKPQAPIDSWLGAITIDPLQFARAKPKDQFDALKGMVKGFDFAANTKARTRAYDERTDVARVAKEQHTLADKIVLPPGKVPAEQPDVGALANLLREAMTHNAEIEARRSHRERARADADRMMDEAEQLRAKAATLEKQARDAIDKLETLAVPLPPPMDTVEISAKMATASADFQAWQAAQQRKKHEAAAEAADKLVTDLTATIKGLDEDKVEAIERAKLPVPGLGLGDDMVLLNGLPFEQAGTAEKLRASIAIGMADNPTLRIMLIDDGSEMDSKSMKLVTDLAREHDYQLWIVRVSDGGGVGFTIENGEVA